MMEMFKGKALIKKLGRYLVVVVLLRIKTTTTKY